MKKLWIFVVIAATMGTATAWGINFYRFGHRQAWLGPFSMNGDITPDNVMEIVRREWPDGNATVEVGETNYDFGMMAPGSEGEHTFFIKNVGEQDLRLRLGATTCKCTLGELDREALAPGEETEIKLSWKVKQGETEFAQSAQVITNDPARVVIQFEIVGKVISEIDIVPDAWSFGEVATGEPFEVSGTIYSFLDQDILPTDVKFSSEEMTELAEIDVEPFKPTEENDGTYAIARQGFRVKATVQPGMRQGAVSQSLVFGFVRLDENGDPEKPAEGDPDPNDYLYASTVGSIVGPLSMLNNNRLKETDGGYIYEIGRVGPDDSTIQKTFVVLKGKERDNTVLSVGKVTPEGVVRATLGEPAGRGKTKLYPLEIELVPGKETIERMGKDGGDYGAIWIESDNPKVSKMRIALKFAIEGR